MANLHFETAPELFAGGRIENLNRQPIRPLGAFSDFVVESLPGEINLLRKLSSPESLHAGLRALGHKIDRILAATKPDLNRQDWPEDQLGVACIDVIYAYNAFIQLASMSGLDVDAIDRTAVPESLHKLVKQSAHIRTSIPTMTYGDMILRNPLQEDPRVYSTDEKGLAERDFCIGHKYIEFRLDQAIRSIEENINGTAEELKAALELAAGPMWEVSRVMKSFRDDMQPGLFEDYRQFYSKHPGLGTLGPSGRFSARVAHLTILLIGDLIHAERPQFYESLFALRDLYPPEGFARLQRRIDPDFCPNVNTAPDRELDGRRLSLAPPISGGYLTVSQAVKAFGSPEPLARAFDHCRHLLDVFTGTHIVAVKKYTVNPGLPFNGTETNEPIDRILYQRFRIGRPSADPG